MNGQQSSAAKGLFVLVAISTLLAMIANAPQLSDPFLRYDDFAALLGHPEEYYHKTLDEGRWLNYVWISRPVLWSSATNYLVYLTGWAVFAAAFAALSLGMARTARDMVLRTALAALVVVTPQTFDIAHSFTTLIPGVWIVATYAVTCVFLPRRTTTFLLFIFVPLAFSTHSTYPFLVLACHLLRHDTSRSLNSLAIDVGCFAVAFALALGLTYSLNWHYHGTFGINVAEWRQPRAASNLGELIANIGRLPLLLWAMTIIQGHGNFWAGYAVFILGLLSLAALLLKQPLEALYVLTASFLGLGLLFLYALKNGIFVPPRATLFVWVGMSYALVRAVQTVGTSRLGRYAGGLTVLILIGFGTFSFLRQHLEFRPWQSATRMIADAVPSGVGEVIIEGDFMTIDGARAVGIQNETALRDRIAYLTGTRVTICKTPASSCRAHVRGDQTFVFRLPRYLKLE